MNCQHMSRVVKPQSWKPSGLTHSKMDDTHADDVQSKGSSLTKVGIASVAERGDGIAERLLQ